MRPKKQDKINLVQLREDIKKVVEQGEIIKSHFKKMQEYYEEWEHNLNLIDKRVTEAAKQTGLTEAEVSQYDAVDDMFS